MASLPLVATEIGHELNVWPQPGFGANIRTSTGSGFFNAGFALIGWFPTVVSWFGFQLLFNWFRGSSSQPCARPTFYLIFGNKVDSSSFVLLVTVLLSPASWSGCFGSLGLLQRPHRRRLSIGNEPRRSVSSYLLFIRNPLGKKRMNLDGNREEEMWSPNRSTGVFSTYRVLGQKTVHSEESSSDGNRRIPKEWRREHSWTALLAAFGRRSQKGLAQLVYLANYMTVLDHSFWKQKKHEKTEGFWKQSNMERLKLFEKLTKRIDLSSISLRRMTSSNCHGSISGNTIQVPSPYGESSGLETPLIFHFCLSHQSPLPPTAPNGTAFLRRKSRPGKYFGLHGERLSTVAFQYSDSTSRGNSPSWIPFFK
nr:hypothetical protein Iba_chr09dCG14850 [Ipomoea batatas]